MRIFLNITSGVLGKFFVRLSFVELMYFVAQFFTCHGNIIKRKQSLKIIPEKRITSKAPVIRFLPEDI